MPASILGAGDAVLAFDVGGTDLKAALIDEAGSLHGIIRVPTPPSDGGTAESLLAEIERRSERFRADYPRIQPGAAGLLVPGLVDDAAGIGVSAENLGWRNVPFRERAEQLLAMPVAFGHDVRGAGMAEFRLGAAAAYRDVVVVTIGTGIASAVFIDGQPYLAGGYAGEIGHSVVDPLGPLCACGGHGCLEAVASAAAIAKNYTRVTGTPVAGAKDVLSRSRAGDTVAAQVWDNAIGALAIGIAQLVAILAPEAIVVGGGLSAAGDALFIPLAARVDAALTFHRRPKILPATIGQDAGLIGAALLARELSGTRSASS